MSPGTPAPPSSKHLTGFLDGLLTGFDVRSLAYPAADGRWLSPPQALRDCAAHELLFELGALPANTRAGRFELLLAPLVRPGCWEAAFALGSALQGSAASAAPAGAAWEVLLWSLAFEALRLNSDCPVADWNREGLKRRQSCRARLDEQSAFLAASLNPDQAAILLKALAEMQAAPDSPFSPLAQRLAEEDDVARTLEALAARATSSSDPDEAWALILERILPTQGIIANTSPALLRPCLGLLNDPRLPAESGVPYYATVVLSILRDPRSSGTLVDALDRIPVHQSKIRENLIYTLGNLQEERAVPALARLLELEDETAAPSDRGVPAIRSLVEQKMEAIWALGKVGAASVQAIPVLARYADHPSPQLRTILAWTLGQVGRAQKERTGGVEAEAVIALLKLLRTNARQVFEECVAALRKIDMPEFVHSLYLSNVGAVTILGLKPAQRGLYELSETLHFLLRSKPRTVMAVNGDSGTGKTYFCHALLDGFGQVKPEEILYLMRDRKKGQNVFNRMLGLSWLKKHIDPAYYYDYPLPESEDDPDAYFRQFLEENACKKLIILDGCRDSLYFQKVIDLFYEKGELDVEVNFRATFSTRRLNLEEREVALESVQMHLAFLEEPALEDTPLYQDGIVLLYDLDNSLASRLSGPEVQELFGRRKIEAWGDLIRIGDFGGRGIRPLHCEEESLALRDERLSPCLEKTAPGPARTFAPEERHLAIRLNENLRLEPNLLMTVPLGNLAAERIRFYAQEQIAGLTEDGTAFVLTLVNNRIFHTPAVRSAGLTLIGRDFFLLAERGELLNLSFERTESRSLGRFASPGLCLATYGRDRVITGHEDGRVRAWDLEADSCQVLEGHDQAVTCVAADYQGRIYSGGADGSLKQWDLEREAVRGCDFPGERLLRIKPYPQGRMLALSQDSRGISKVRILDMRRGAARVIAMQDNVRVSDITVYFDGRLIAGLSGAAAAPGESSPSLAILTPHEAACTSLRLSGHRLGTRDCLTMGPKIISCGLDDVREPALKVWGTEFYVRLELEKLALKPR